MLASFRGSPPFAVSRARRTESLAALEAEDAAFRAAEQRHFARAPRTYIYVSRSQLLTDDNEAPEASSGSVLAPNDCNPADFDIFPTPSVTIPRNDGLEAAHSLLDSPPSALAEQRAEVDASQLGEFEARAMELPTGLLDLPSASTLQAIACPQCSAMEAASAPLRFEIAPTSLPTAEAVSLRAHAHPPSKSFRLSPPLPPAPPPPPPPLPPPPSLPPAPLHLFATPALAAALPHELAQEQPLAVPAQPAWALSASCRTLSSAFLLQPLPPPPLPTIEERISSAAVRELRAARASAARPPTSRPPEPQASKIWHQKLTKNIPQEMIASHIGAPPLSSASAIAKPELTPFAVPLPPAFARARANLNALSVELAASRSNAKGS